MQTSLIEKISGIIVLLTGVIIIGWAIIPSIGAFAFWFSIIMLFLSTLALIRTIRHQDPPKKEIIIGFFLCLMATGISTYRVAHYKDITNALTFKQIAK